MTRRASSGGGKAEEENEDTCPSWVNGIKCVLNVTVALPGFDLPLNPPIASYLEEVAMGMIGGAGDPAVACRTRYSRRPGTRVTAAQRSQAVDSMMRDAPVVNSCKVIFWLVLAGIFGHIPQAALVGLRQQLGVSWYALMLDIMQAFANDKLLQDAVFATLPFMFAQAAYRLLVDGFVEDRKHFVNGGESLVLKASQIAHFELTGFQLTAETVGKSRQRVFLARVIRSPYVDQRELVKGRKRQEALENASGNLGEQPLEFGKMAQPMEETQLDHVMHGSEQQRRKSKKELGAGKPVWELETTPVPDTLSVQRYEVLASGGQMMDRHIDELRSLVGLGQAENCLKAQEKIASAFSSPRCGSDSGSPTGWSPLGSPAQVGSAAIAREFYVTSSSSPATASAANDGELPSSSGAEAAGLDGGDGSGSPQSRNKKMWRKGLIMAKVSMAKEETRSRKEKELKAHKMRQETVVRHIAADELPPGLCVRTLNTSWVSPAMANLSQADDRWMLRMPTTDCFQLKMRVNTPHQQRPMSTPAARKNGSGCGSGAGSPASRLQAGAPLPGGPLGGLAVALPRVLAAAGKAPGGCKDSERMGGSGSASAPALTGGSNKSGGPGRPGERARSGETIFLGPPPTLRKEVVLQRLEGHEKAFLKGSFALYAKEHDILTGAKKNRSDPKLLKDAEDTYIKKMDELVGGSAKRLIAPEGVGARNGRQGGGGGTPPVGTASGAAAGTATGAPAEDGGGTRR